MADSKETDSSVDENLKFMTWTSYLEDLISNWADNALSYSWLNLQSETKYRRLNYMFTIPIVILSTIVGTINVGMNSLFPPNLVQYGQIGKTELSLEAMCRKPAGEFFRHAKAEMDRLLDSSPYIPSDVIKKYASKNNIVELPEIIGNLKSTTVYRGGLRMSPKQSPTENFIKIIGDSVDALDHK